MSFFKNIFGNSDESEEQSKMNWSRLTSISQLDDIISLSNEKPIVIFKHSTRCIISRMALKQFEKEFDLLDKITPYFLDLLEHRDISNEIAQRFGVMHQSPQLLLIENGASSYNASHENISAITLKNKI
ncbi:bacillithiol system redox-active protein YtxJ [Flavobacterium sp.]|uniref:bacillithiol system redox-active protein YtxJ n=1 Tax=Flavobacterium sp. TaxID=239 RepID=UPI00261899E7|nr:bacillithiol system redox-active protein YtxJ [Flavobacterium sp.]